jgi:hypothetical protein
MFRRLLRLVRSRLLRTFWWLVIGCGFCTCSPVSRCSPGRRCGRGVTVVGCCVVRRNDADTSGGAVTSRSYVGAPRVYLTHGVHEDGEWKRMWYVNHFPGVHFWTWREELDYALSLPVPENPRPRKAKR